MPMFSILGSSTVLPVTVYSFSFTGGCLYLTVSNNQVNICETQQRLIELFQKQQLHPPAVQLSALRHSQVEESLIGGRFSIIVRIFLHLRIQSKDLKDRIQIYLVTLWCVSVQRLKN